MKTRNLIWLMMPFMLFSCDKQVTGVNGAEPESEQELPDVSFVMTKSQEDFVADNNAFAFDLLSYVMNDKSASDDFIVSPLSVSFVMNALANGAQGQTRSQIIDALGYDGIDLNQVNDYSKMLIEGCGAVDRKVTVGINNALFVNKDYTLKTAFSQNLDNYYDAFVASADFANPSALKTINDWCNEKSSGLIPTMIDNLSPQAAMCALNCMYFKGRWKAEFSPSLTKDGEFTDIDGMKHQVSMMSKKNNPLRYVSNDKFQAVSLPFGRGMYRMYVILPTTGNNVFTVAEALNAEAWNTALSAMKTAKVNLMLPKFETETSLDLTEILKSAGMSDAFDASKADFSGMTEGQKQIYLSLVKQNGRIRIDEEGAEAAAITAVVMDGAGIITGDPVEFHADRPFIYLIQESSSGAVFFVGVKGKA